MALYCVDGKTIFPVRDKNGESIGEYVSFKAKHVDHLAGKADMNKKIPRTKEEYEAQ